MLSIGDSMQGKGKDKGKDKGKGKIFGKWRMENVFLVVLLVHVR